MWSNLNKSISNIDNSDLNVVVAMFFMNPVTVCDYPGFVEFFFSGTHVKNILRKTDPATMVKVREERLFYEDISHQGGPLC